MESRDGIMGMRPENSRWRIEMLGGLVARQEDLALHRFRAQKPGALLAYLAYYPSRPHPREVLAELLWPGSEPRASRNSLNTAISSLRRQLEPPGIAPGTVIAADRFTVRLNPAAFTTDVAEFQSALRSAARSANREAQIPHLTHALDLYQGELLPGYYEDWVLTEQRRLADLYYGAVRQLVSLADREQDIAGAIDRVRRALGMDSLREDLHQQLMRLYAVAGQPDAALRHYAALQHLLAEQLGRKPSAATRQIAAAIEQQEQQLSAAPELTVRRIRRETNAGNPLPEQTMPTGTVTFLLTDIERSTRHWEKIGDAFRNALEDHHRMLRSAFARFDGREVKEMGDGFLVAFARAGDALACAVAAQQDLAGHVWPPDVDALRVRMAVHTGDIEMRDGDYHGLVLHRASRILAAAHGGQILCSEVTAAILQRDLPGDIRLQDVGSYRLRDVPAPMRLFTVLHSGVLERDIPPPNALPGFSSSLPLQVTRFLGREAELSRLHALLVSEHPRLITLSGPGGTGKTRLAIEAAGRTIGRCEWNVCFVPLAELTEARLLCPAILQALRVPALPDQDGMEQTVVALSHQSCLLVLDNLEQVAEEAAPIVHALLTRVSGLKCLATSRQWLNIPGEQEFAVTPLPIPNGADAPAALLECDSVRLFVDRAQAAKPDFQLTDRNAAAVAALCDRLEGLPLAIELAAARAQVLPPAQMLAEMENRFDFLASRQRVTEERHRTLRAAIDWSYRLLDARARALFARLSAFRGGWTLEAAAVVCGDEAVLDGLTQLCEASLVVADEYGEVVRFRMLNMLRAFAEEQLPAAEGETVRRLHADYYVALAQDAAAELRGARQIEWLDRMDPEQDNLRAALEWASRSEDHDLTARLAATFYPFLYHRGAWHEARHCLEAGLLAATALGKPGGALQARMECDLAGLNFDMGDPQEAMRRAEKSLDIWRKLAPSGPVAEALNLMGLLELQAGAFAAARQRFLEVLELRSDPHGRALALHNLARLAGRNGDFDEAKRLYELALMNRRAAGDSRGEAETLGNLGAVAYHTGDYKASRRLYLESLRLYRDVRFPLGVAMMLNNLAELAEVQDALEEALRLFAGAERLLRELHSRHAEEPAARLRRLALRVGAERSGVVQQEAGLISWEQMADELAVMPENF